MERRLAPLTRTVRREHRCLLALGTDASEEHAGGLKRTWKRIIRDAEVGHVRFHDLRHASATYMFQAGVPVKVVSERLGHSRTSTTTDTYAHVMPGMGRHAAELLERVMHG